jgi:hypothetical protein
MMARLALIAKVMLRRCEETIGHHQIGGIAGIRCQSSEAPREFERSAKIAVIELVDAQAPKSAQPVGAVAEPLRELERGCPGGACLACAADAVHQRPAELCGKLHARSGGRRVVVPFQNGQRPLNPIVALP